ncbi:MAG TPA: DNA-directed RNA polymerase subunit omega [Bacteroidota bacterium]|nr:DNA-directed RNA polymerase subunit omega [Bacteroidota bacterium]
MAIKPVDMANFFGKIGNLYEGVVVTAKRARQIHDELKLEFRQRSETLQQISAVTTEVEDDSDPVANPDQLKISLEFEQRSKPADSALTEVVKGKIVKRYKEVEAPVEQEKEEEKEAEPEE